MPSNPMSIIRYRYCVSCLNDSGAHVQLLILPFPPPFTRTKGPRFVAQEAHITNPNRKNEKTGKEHSYPQGTPRPVRCVHKTQYQR